MEIVANAKSYSNEGCGIFPREEGNLVKIITIGWVTCGLVPQVAQYYI
jgi:hypothetical protein